MSDAELIRDVLPGYRKKFDVKIDIADLSDSAVKNIIQELRDLNWDFASDLADIIEGKKS